MQVFHLSMFKGKLGELLGADLRSLAALRVAMAVLIIVDLLLRSRDLVPHYIDTGALPRIAVLDQTTSRWLISLHLINGTWEMQAILFVLAGAFAVALLVGYKTPLATIVSWILLASLDSRNLVVLDGGDTMLRVLLFWPFFCRGDLVGRLIVL